MEAGVHYTDLGGLFHYTRKQLALKDEFRKKNLTAVLGSGITPGITNVMAAYAASKLDTVVKPRNLLIKIISDQTPQNIEPDDCDVIRVEVSGKKDKRKVQYTMESIVRPHPKWKVSAGALDTGVPASIVGIMLAEGEINKKGVLAPEECIEPLSFFRELARRNINVYSVVKEKLY